MTAVEVNAHCKINLCLEVLRRRTDGYHELATVFQAVTLADCVRVEPREEAGITLTLAGEPVPVGRDNLVWRAVEVYQQMRNWPEGARIALTKLVPVGAGLGGGSSDAAAVMQGLAELDPQPPDVRELTEALAGLGSDVPFFLTHGTAFGRSRGDELVGLADLPECWIVLAKPDMRISTAEAYPLLESRDFSDGGQAHEMADAIDSGAELAEIAALACNAFARPLTERWPIFAELKQRLRDAGALAAEITGSGSALFGLFDAPEPAGAAVKTLTADGLWARLVEPVSVDADIIARVE